MKTTWKVWLGALLAVALLLGCACAVAEEFNVNVPSYILTGESYNVDVQKYDGATQYEVTLYDPLTWHRTWSQVVKDEEAEADENGWFTVTVPDSQTYEKHVFVLRVFAQQVDEEGHVEYIAGQGAYPIAVENEESLPSGKGDLELILPDQNAAPYQDLFMVLDAPEAESVMVSIEDVTRTFNGPRGYIFYWPQEAGTYHITGIAVYADGTQTTITDTIEVKGEGGKLGDMAVNFPETIKAGQNDAKVTASKVSALPEGADVNYTFQVVDLTNLQEVVFNADFVTVGDEWDPDKTREKMGDSQTITISTDDEEHPIFQAGHTYRLYVYATCAGYADVIKYQDYPITAAEETAIGVRFTIADADEGVGMSEKNSYVTPTAEKYDVRIQLTGNGGDYSSVRRVLLSEGWYDYENLEEWGEDFFNGLKDEGFAVFTRSHDNADQQSMYVTVGYGPEDAPDEELTWVVSNVLYITNEAKGGKLSAPTAVADKTTVTRGEMVTLTVTADQNAADTHAWLEGAFEGNWYGIFRLKDGKIMIPTIAMEPGLYQVVIYSSGEGYSSNSTSLMLRVAEPEEELTGVTLQVSSNEVVTCEEYTLTAYAPGADWIDVFYDYENNGEWTDNWGGDNFIDQRSYGHSGEYKMVAIAHYTVKDENGEPQQDAEGNWVELDTQESAPVIMRVSAEGQVGIIDPEGIPAIITAGDHVELTVQKPENAERYNIDVWWDDENGGLFGAYDITKDETKVIFDVGEDLPETWAHVEIYGYGYNVDDDSHRWDIPVIPQGPDASVILKLEGLDENGEILVNQNATLEISAIQGAGEIRTISVFDGNNYWNHDPLDEDGTYTRDISFGEAKTYAVFAKVTFDDWNEEWDGTDYDGRTWLYTNAVTLTAISKGEVGPLTISYADTKEDHQNVTRGETVLVQMSESKDATNYWPGINCNVDWDNGEEDWPFEQHWDWADEEKRIARVYTAGMPEGEYWISGCASAEGMLYYDSEWDNQVVYLQVNEPVITEDQPYFSFIVNEADDDNQVNILTGGQFSITAYVPGAEWIDVFYNWPNDENMWDNFGGDHITGQNTSPYWGVGDYTMIARAYYPQYDENGEPILETDEEGNQNQVIYWLDSAEYTVHVTSSGEVIDIPMADLPLYLAPGSGMEVNVTAPEGTAWMHVNVSVINEDGFWWPDSIRDWQISDGKLNVSESLSWDELDEMGVHAGQTLVVSTNGGMPGFELRGWEVKIPVVDWTPEETPGAYLTFANSEDPDALEALVNQQIWLDINPSDVADGRQIQVVRVFNGDHFEGENYPDGNGDFNLSVFRGEEKQYAIYAMVTYDEWQEEWDGQEGDPRVWLPTNVITLTLTSNGSVGSFEIQGVPEEPVMRGEFFEVTLTESEHADNYWLNSDGEYELNWSWADEENRVARISTVFLGEGEYYFYAGSNGVGLDGYNTDSVKFTVAEPDDAGVVLRVEPAGDLILDERSYVNVYARGAVHVGFVLDGNAWHLDENGNYQWGECTDSWYHNDGIKWDEEMGVGEHTLQGCALYEGSDEWVYSEPVKVNIQSLGKLVEPTLNVNAAYSATEDMTFSVEGLDQEHAAWWWVHVQDEDDRDENGEPKELGHWDSQHYDKIPETFVVDRSGLFDGHRLHVSASVIADGYITANAYRQVVVVGNADDKITLTIEKEDGDDFQAWPANKNLRVRVSAPGSSAVKIWNDGQWDYRDSNNMDEDGVYTIDLNYNDPHTYTIFAMVSYTKQTWDENFDWGSFDWERDMEWTATSNQIDVTIESKGTLAEPKYTVNSITVNRGDMFEITITADQGRGENYGARLVIPYIDGVQDYWESEYYSWDEETKTISVPTSYAEPRDYQIMVWVWAEGWTGNSAYTDVMITEPEDAIVFETSVGKDGLTTWQDATVSVYARDAARVEVFYDYERELNENEDPWTNYWDGDNGWGSFSYSETGTYVLIAKAYDENGEVIATSAPVSVKVTAKDPEPLKINGSVAADPTKDYTFYVEGLEKMNRYWVVTVFEIADGEWNEVSTWDTDSYANNVFTLSAGQIAEDRVYVIEAQGNAYGHERANATMRFVGSALDLTKTFSLKIPSALFEVDEEAFEGVNLDVVILAEETEWNKIAFLNDYAKILVIPDNASKEDYEGYIGILLTQTEYQEQLNRN